MTRRAFAGEASVAAVGSFTRGAPWLVEGCLDVRRPCLPLLGGGSLVMKLALRSEVPEDLRAASNEYASSSWSCTSSRDTPPRGPCARRAFVLVDGDLTVLMKMGRSWASQQVDLGTPDTSTPTVAPGGPVRTP